jgi:hypothetical protein
MDMLDAACSGTNRLLNRERLEEKEDINRLSRLLIGGSDGR